MMPPPDHKKEMKSNYLSFCEYLTKILTPPLLGLSGYLLQFWSYSFDILYDVYTHHGGVHVHRILIFLKGSQNER
jgi:hypothetical protein